MAILGFLLVLPIIIIVHEFGHFLFARLTGVKVEAFSIGFGKELIGWNDKKGTRWRISLIPLGGYVRLFGQADTPQEEGKELKKAKKLSKEEQKVHFEHKKLYQKFLIVFAGPLFNFLFTYLIFVLMFTLNGKPEIKNIVGNVMKDTPAAEAGIKKDDRIAAVNNQETKTFDEIKKQVSLSQKEGKKEISLKLQRKQSFINVKLTPDMKTGTPLIGIASSPESVIVKKIGFFESLKVAAVEIKEGTVQITKGLWSIITGKQSPKKLGGIIRIAEISGDALKAGFVSFIFFMATLSLHLGILNLLPIPVVDGGHLVFFIIEGLIRRPIPDKIKEKLLMAGLFMLLSLLVLTFYNDITRLFTN